MEVNWFYIVEFWVLPGMGRSFFKFETESQVPGSKDKKTGKVMTRVKNSNDGLEYCD